MDSARVIAAALSVGDATKSFNAAMTTWDEAVSDMHIAYSNMQLAWVAVRKAQRHLADAQAVFAHETKPEAR